VAARADDGAEQTTVAKPGADAKPAKLKAAKSHHRSVRRKDPAKW
jgi:hypothetical protein